VCARVCKYASLQKGEQRQGALAPQLPRTTRNSIPEVSDLRVFGRLRRLFVRCNCVSDLVNLFVVEVLSFNLISIFFDLRLPQVVSSFLSPDFS